MPLLDKLREQYGVGPLCSELHIAPSTYYHCQQQRHHPDKRSARAQRDDWLKTVNVLPLSATATSSG